MAIAPHRLVVDQVACDGHAICALLCPDRVALDEWGHAMVEETLISERAVLRRARRAVAACPERALQLVPGREGRPPGRS